MFSNSCIKDTFIYLFKSNIFSFDLFLAFICTDRQINDTKNIIPLTEYDNKLKKIRFLFVLNLILGSDYWHEVDIRVPYPNKELTTTTALLPFYKRVMNACRVD